MNENHYTGNLTADPEVRPINSGGVVVRFRIAINGLAGADATRPASMFPDAEPSTSADPRWLIGRLGQAGKRKQAGEVRMPCAVSDLVGPSTADNGATGGADGRAVSQHVGRREGGEPSRGLVLCHSEPPSDRGHVTAWPARWHS